MSFLFYSQMFLVRRSLNCMQFITGIGMVGCSFTALQTYRPAPGLTHLVVVHWVLSSLYLGVRQAVAKRLRWSRGSVLAFGTQVRWFKPGRSRRIFQGEKILSTPSFGREVKPFVPCRIFAACKRTRKCMRGSRSFRSKLPAISRPSSSSFHY